MADNRTRSAKQNALTLQRLREVFHYDPETGDWTRLMICGRFKIGSKVGYLNRGCLRIRVDNFSYEAHRLAFFYMAGRWPADEIDHIDLDRGNCRWNNLREATTSQNEANKKPRSAVGLKGVNWNISTKKWRAQIWKHGKKTSLGYYDCPAAAHFAYVIEAHGLYGEFARFQ